MWALLIEVADPQIEIGLQLVDRTIHLFAERDTVELVEHGLVEALTDAVGLRALGLGCASDRLGGAYPLAMTNDALFAIFLGSSMIIGGIYMPPRSGTASA
jgi:hypothetical protein